MKFSFDRPKVFDYIELQFGVNWNDGIAVAYGDTIHCDRALTPDLLAHERIHLAQQEKWGDPESWWKKYLGDRHFRLEQEIEAYKEQIKFINTAVKDRNQAFSLKRRLYHDLSGPMYGNLCTTAEAQRLIS